MYGKFTCTECLWSGNKIIIRSLIKGETFLNKNKTYTFCPNCGERIKITPYCNKCGNIMKLKRIDDVGGNLEDNNGNIFYVIWKCICGNTKDSDDRKYYCDTAIDYEDYEDYHVFGDITGNKFFLYK